MAGWGEVSALDALAGDGRRLRLRTLVNLRWVAICGQTGAIVAAHYGLGLRLPLGPLVATVGASVLLNVVVTALAPRSHRLSEHETEAMLLFDILQLSVLLALSGGLNNPFAVLIVAPVTISAAVLRPLATLLLGALAVSLVTLVWRVHLPLVTASGQVLALPGVLSQGFWAALVIGIAFLAGYVARVAAESRAMSEALLATQMALEREQKLTDIGSIVAAAAHELGTPLATIKLVSSELARELADRPALAEDVALIREQVDRCRDILRSMGSSGKDDRHLRIAPVEALVREAARPHEPRGKTVVLEARPQPGGDAEQPLLPRRPEIIHGLRNLIQNAVDFARSHVWIDIVWDGETVMVRVTDDGPGFPPAVLDRIGDPFVRRREAGGEGAPARPGYEGMGLGLFIAKTLLERTGATLTFANAAEPQDARGRAGARSGALVEVRWPRAIVAAPPKADRAALGRNEPYRADRA